MVSTLICTEDDCANSRVIRYCDTYDVIKIVVKIYFFIDFELDVIHYLQALDAVKGNDGNLLSFFIIPESKPAVVVLLEVIGMKNEVHVTPAILVSVIFHLEHLVLGGGIDEFNARYVDNGLMDFLVKEREAGRIRNLGFSFHGYKNVFDQVLAMHDLYHWDFVQIELNYLDWNFANEINSRNVDASYLYAELQKVGIPAVIMEPLLGGRLAKLPQYIVNDLKRRDPERSVASWAFRYAGTPEGVLTVLSGMTYMEHLKDNLLSYCPLKPLNDTEMDYLHTDIANKIFGLENIPCNDCKYCVPCPYGVDIPSIFVHYNKCKNEGLLPQAVGDPDYRQHRRNFLISLDRTVPRNRQADHCIGCGQCEPHCPQKIRIPRELHKLDQMIEDLKRNPTPDPSREA